MKTRILLFALACLCIGGCKNATQPLKIKSMEVQYPTRTAYSETYNFRYDSEGRLTTVEKCEVADGEKFNMSWKYAYDAEELKAVSEAKGWRGSRTGEVIFQDDFNHMASYTLPEEKEENEYGIVFLGQTWVATYDGGRLDKAVFTDFTSDGMDVGMLTWGEDGLLLKFEGSDPGVFNEIKDIEYLETSNPFEGPDPVAMVMGMSAFYWQGFAGPRPALLIGGYTQVSSDPWVEDVSIDHVAITCETDKESRISRITQTVDGQIEKVVILSY